MERMRDYSSYETVQSPDRNFMSQFERHTEISEAELKRVRFMPEMRRLTLLTPETAIEVAPERAVEAVWHPNTQTLVVPPPSSGVEGVEALAKMSLPVVAFIDQIEPDVVIGCDRGGRLFSLATFSMWRSLHGQTEHFPTLDEKMRFAHLSRRFGPAVFAELVEDILQRTGSEQKHGKNGETLRFLFIDDHVSTGATRRYAREALDLIGLDPDKADMYFAISWGTEADVSGGKASIEEPWQNKPRMIGVEYDRDHIGRPVHSDEARKIRADLHKAVRTESRALRAGRVARRLLRKAK